MSPDLVGVVKVGTVRKWLEHKRRWDVRFKQTKARIHKKRLRDMAVGYEVFGEGEVPPPTALAGRRKLGVKESEKKKAHSMGLSLWALWGSKHDQMTVKREQLAEKTPEVAAAPQSQGQGARAFSDLQRQEELTRRKSAAPSSVSQTSGRAWRTLVKDEHQTEKGAVGGDVDLRPAGPVDDAGIGGEQTSQPKTAGLLSPDDAHETGITGKRVMIGGLATPFSLRKEPETASMITLGTPMDQSSIRHSTADASSFAAPPSTEVSEATKEATAPEHSNSNDQDGASLGMASPFLTPISPTSPSERPGLERFVTAEENVPKVGH